MNVERARTTIEMRLVVMGPRSGSDDRADSPRTWECPSNRSGVCSTGCVCTAASYTCDIDHRSFLKLLSSSDREYRLSSRPGQDASQPGRTDLDDLVRGMECQDSRPTFGLRPSAARSCPGFAGRTPAPRSAFGERCIQWGFATASIPLTSQAGLTSCSREPASPFSSMAVSGTAVRSIIRHRSPEEDFGKGNSLTTAAETVDIGQLCSAKAGVSSKFGSMRSTRTQQLVRNG